jgi:murein DD-endopeptidase MepM/ murein hydrolase activator NlpD
VAAAWLIAISPLPALAAATLHSSFDLQVPVAPSLINVGGRPQWIYEVLVTNTSDTPMELTRVQVLDGQGAAVADLQGVALEQHLGGAGRTAEGEQRRTLAAGAQAVLYLEIEAGQHASAQALSHRIDYRIMRKQGPVEATVEGARTVVSTTPLPVLSPPLRGGPWIAIHEPSWTRGHRRMVYAVAGRAHIPGRYAIDWVKLDAKGRITAGDEDRPADHYGYGEEVLAVADGVVVAARDDMAESASVAAHPRHTLADATGNYLALEIEGGRHVFYEHLKPGSLRAKVGQRVRRGEVVAALGFTGDSSGPHLHFHLADANSPLDAGGMPYVLADFTALGAYPSLDALGKQPWQPPAASEQARRRNERPAPNTVVQFP